MIDTHAHLTDQKYADTVQTIIDSMSSDGLDKIFTVAYNYQSVLDCLALVSKHDNIYAIIGVHPCDWADYDKTKQLLIDNANNPKVVGIGEIGLDYHYPDTNKEQQKRIFVDQLQLAHDYNLPISIHVRDAIGDLMQILEENAHLLTSGGVVHCFSESVEVYKRVTKLGLKIAFGGVVTFKNAVKAVEVARVVNMNDFVLETDCPYLTPEPYRGKEINQPKYVRYVADKIANIKGITTEAVMAQTTANALKIFTKAN